MDSSAKATLQIPFSSDARPPRLDVQPVPAPVAPLGEAR
jgi:hypothetical protein